MKRTDSIAQWAECLPLLWVQSQVSSYFKNYAPLLNTQQYKVRIKGKVEQSTEKSNAHPYTSV